MFLTKEPVLNDMTLLRDGRVLVVHCVDVWILKFQLSWNVSDAKASERATPAFFRWISLLIPIARCSRINSAEEGFTNAGSGDEIGGKWGAPM